MKSFSKFFIPVLAAGLFAACSDDNNDSPMLPEDGPAEGVNMTISLKLPTTVGGRADEAVKNPVGEENGKDFENKINEVVIVLADQSTNAFIAQALSTSMEVDAIDKTKATAKSTFNKSVLVNYITEKDLNDLKVNVYAFCNPSSEFKSAIASRSRGDKAETWINTTTTLSSDVLTYSTVSATAGVPMANKEIVAASLPAKTDIENGKYSEENSAFDLSAGTPINVIRSIARFDYKSGATNDTYAIKIKSVDNNGAITEIDNGLQIKLTHMTMVNLSKSYYLLHRVSNDKISTNYTTTDSKVTLCGSYDDTFIADTDWANKVSSNFLHAYNTTTKKFDMPTATALNALNGDDNDDTWNNSGEYNDYKIWRYVTENTIPSPAQNQKTGVSTGVVFRGVLEATTATPTALKDALTAHTPIYIYKDGTIFASWEAVAKEAAKAENANTAIKAAYDACQVITDQTKKDEKAVELGFTIYRYDNDVNEYCTLYYYWNRHVDNNNDGVMGEKEFGVVRNNIYKLSVTEIKALGHTRDPKDDPDPVDPNDPDEKSDVHIKVSCKVTPWTVRVNNIKF